MSKTWTPEELATPERILQIRRSHENARPKDCNPAWVNTHRDLSVVLAYVDKLSAALEKIAQCRKSGNLLESTAYLMGDWAISALDAIAVAPQPPAAKEAEPAPPAARTTSDVAYESLSPELRKKLDADILVMEQQMQDHRRSRERRQHVVPVDVEKRLADRRGAKD